MADAKKMNKNCAIREVDLARLEVEALERHLEVARKNLKEAQETLAKFK